MFAKALVFSALVTAAFAADCARTYTVKGGDWCDTISQANNASTYQLSTVNADKINDACTNLEIGQVLCLGTKGQDCTVTHTVVAGDTCDKVIMGAGINATMLYTNNPQIDEYCSNIYVGEVLCVANEALSPAQVNGRHVGSTGGAPAGPPAPSPYPEAKVPKAKPTSSSSIPSAPSTSPSKAPAHTKAPTSTSTSSTPATTPESHDDDDDANLPECEDPNDDGYY